ncbi:tyrosine-type recombinase/integrase [Pseudodesulfovibrio profundus]|nr:tyrosine-type recombinase/integrase [Pseudodesulfovibrio profundus]
MSNLYLSLFDAESSLEYHWDNPGVVYDRFGHSVDTSGEVWELTDPTRTNYCNWKRAYCAKDNLETVKAYVAHCIETKAPHTVGNIFYYLIEDEKNDILDNYPLSMCNLLSLLDCYRESGEEWKFHWVRKWYVWCTDVAFPGFSRSICEELLNYSIEGNEKGVAVLTEDPDDGPLDNVEYDLLRSVVKSGVGSEFERICIMLCMELGANPKNIVLLEERDFIKNKTSSGSWLYSLNVPRIKKRSSSRSVRARKISPHLGQFIDRLIEINNDNFGRPYAEKTPILRSNRKRYFLSRSLKRFEFHMTTRDFCKAVQKYPIVAKLVSRRSGDILHLTPRRLRYTFATRLVEQGASPAVVADALDHTDLQHVAVYFKARGKTVEALDKALECNPHYLDVISRFSGIVVEREETNGIPTVPGETPTYRNLGGIGGCGAKSLCKLYPPLSCYLCPSFQAWKDGPHQDMLDELKTYAREMAATSGYPVARITNQVDDVILAISQLLQRIKEME